MNHNPHNLKIGDVCILDKEYSNTIRVKVAKFTPDKMFAVLLYETEEEGETNEWQVMTNRLTPVKRWR